MKLTCNLTKFYSTLSAKPHKHIKVNMNFEQLLKLIKMNRRLIIFFFKKKKKKTFMLSWRKSS
jgi:hypothetical protein